MFMLPPSPSRLHSKCVALRLTQRMVRNPCPPMKVWRATPTASRAFSLTAAAYGRWPHSAVIGCLAGCCSAMSWQAGLGQRSQLHSTAAATDTLVRLNNSIGSSETLLQWWIQKVFGHLSLSFFLCSLPSLFCREVPFLDPDRLFGGAL